MEKRYPPIFQSVPADEFTDREEIIEEMMHWASITPRDMMISTAVVGPRRIGKTAVLEQVYNRLFWEQDEVVPIYFSFEAKPTTSTEFAWAYFINFLQQYIAFRRKDDNLARLDAQEVEPRDLISMAEEMKGDPISVLAPGLFRLLNSPTALLHDKLERVIYLPRRVMEYNRARWKPETPIFVMLDEFQEVMKIRYSDGKPADGVGLYQWAVEGRQCPHIVTGSAVRLITQEILGTGALFGRFEYFPFPPLPNIYGLELVDKLAHKYGLEIPEPVAGYIVTRCGGNPFYIRCVIMRAIRQRLSTVKDKTVVDNLIAYEVTRGLIWRDWSGQLQKYFEQINSQYIAKHILFYAAQFEDEMIDIEVIAKKVNRPPDEVYHILRQLAFAEMIDVRGGVVFFNLKDPILRDFIRAQYELDIEKKPVERKQKELVEEYRRLQEEVFPDLRLGLLHGRMKGEEKEAVMRAFREGELDILVSTSVVEVGIDVPNATVMLVEGAERFGLAQLHQFRGRVGRGEQPSYCLLVSDAATGEAVERLRALEETLDGFALAEKDLELRGPGEFFGTRQSGLPELRIAQLSDLRTLELARAQAQKVFAEDPELQLPEHRLLAQQVARFWRGQSDLS